MGLSDSDHPATRNTCHVALVPLSFQGEHDLNVVRKRNMHVVLADPEPAPPPANPDVRKVPAHPVVERIERLHGMSHEHQGIAEQDFKHDFQQDELEDEHCHLLSSGNDTGNWILRNPTPHPQPQEPFLSSLSFRERGRRLRSWCFVLRRS